MLLFLLLLLFVLVAVVVVVVVAVVVAVVVCFVLLVMRWTDGSASTKVLGQSNETSLKYPNCSYRVKVGPLEILIEQSKPPKKRKRIHKSS